MWHCHWGARHQIMKICHTDKSSPHGNCHFLFSVVTFVSQASVYELHLLSTNSKIKMPREQTTCMYVSDPPENYHLTVKILPKTWHLKIKLTKIFIFFNKIALAILLKNDNFCQLKKVKFLAIFWHSNGNFPEGHV